MIVNRQSLLIFLVGAVSSIEGFVVNSPTAFNIPGKATTVVSERQNSNGALHSSLDDLTGEEPAAVATSEDSEEPTAVATSEDSEEPTAVATSEDSEEPTAVATSEDSEEPTAVATSEGSDDNAVDGTDSEATEDGGAVAKSDDEEHKYTAYCVNLSYETKTKDLYNMFSELGEVKRVYIPNNRNTGRPKGIAFVSMGSKEDLEKVVAKFAETEIDGRTVYVSEAKARGESGPPVSSNTKLYVGNVAFDCSEDDIKEYFSQWGDVLDCYCPTDQETGRPRGFSFVTMKPDDARVAIENSNGVEFSGRRLEVNVSLPRGQKAERVIPVRPPAVKLYVGNLAYGTDDDTLREAVEYAGPVLDLYMPVDRYSGERRGFAFVSVAPENVEKTIEELDGYELDGRILRVNEARPKGWEGDFDPTAATIEEDTGAEEDMEAVEEPDYAE